MKKKLLHGPPLPHFPCGCADIFLTFCVQRKWQKGATSGAPIDLRRNGYARALENVIRRYDRELYALYAYVIMPDHVHMLLQPLKLDAKPVSISRIVQTIKRVSATRINRIRGESGSIWQPNYFDTTVRNPRHFENVLRYIINNPVASGLVDNSDDWEWMGRMD